MRDKYLEIKSVDQKIMDEKRMKQQMYREMLQNQIDTNTKMKTLGNMTHVEKQMNKDDLRAYKEYKNQNFSMVPGINNENKIAFSPPKKKKERYEQEKSWLSNYGFQRGTDFHGKTGGKTPLVLQSIHKSMIKEGDIFSQSISQFPKPKQDYSTLPAVTNKNALD